MNGVDYLRLAVTDRCNLQCLYCRPDRKTFVERSEILSFEEIEKVAEAALDIGITRIRLTGGEPTTRRDLPRLVEKLAGLKGLHELTMTTNGLLLSSMAEELRSCGLSRLNVSLDTLDAVKYQRMTGVDGLAGVLDGIEAAGRAGLDPVKVNVVAMKGFNDDEVKNFALFAAERDLTVRFIEMMPFHCNRGLQKDHYLSADEVLELLRSNFTLEECGSGGPGPARYYRVTGEAGRIGLISPFSRPFCSSCNRLRLTAMGGLRNCLFSDSEIDIKKALRSNAAGKEISELFLSAIRSKKNGHNLTLGEPGCKAFSLSQIGG